MAKASALLGSFEEARQMWADEGISLSVNKLREVCGPRGRKLSRLREQGSVQVTGNVDKRRIVVSRDGGRVRLREPRQGRTKTGRKKFSARWREPRLFIIDAVDEQGRRAQDFAPIIDGTLASCDQLFALLTASLMSLKITQASRVLFVADGAAWIWKRIPQLIQTRGLKPEQVQQLIDFWHAVEDLGQLAESRKLTGAKRTQWLTTQKKRLLRGEIGSVVEALETLLSGRRTKPPTTWLNDFRTHGLKHRRMDDSTSRQHQLPIGSGAIESAIRRMSRAHRGQRTRHLRVKSNATYWLRDNAETMIRLRAWLTAGRAEDLFQNTTSATCDLTA